MPHAILQLILSLEFPLLARTETSESFGTPRFVSLSDFFVPHPLLFFRTRLSPLGKSKRARVFFVFFDPPFSLFVFLFLNGMHRLKKISTKLCQGRLGASRSFNIFTSHRPFTNPFVFCGKPELSVAISTFPAKKGTSSDMSWTLRGSTIFAVWLEGSSLERLCWSASSNSGLAWSPARRIQQSVLASKPFLAPAGDSVLAIWEEAYTSAGTTSTGSRVALSRYPVISPFLFCSSAVGDRVHISNVGNDVSKLTSANVAAGEDGLIVVAYTTMAFEVKVVVSTVAIFRFVWVFFTEFSGYGHHFQPPCSAG